MIWPSPCFKYTTATELFLLPREKYCTLSSSLESWSDGLTHSTDLALGGHLRVLGTDVVSIVRTTELVQEVSDGMSPRVAGQAGQTRHHISVL